MPPPLTSLPLSPRVVVMVVGVGRGATDWKQIPLPFNSAPWAFVTNCSCIPRQKTILPNYHTCYIICLVNQNYCPCWLNRAYSKTAFSVNKILPFKKAYDFWPLMRLFQSEKKVHFLFWKTARLVSENAVNHACTSSATCVAGAICDQKSKRCKCDAPATTNGKLCSKYISLPLPLWREAWHV